MLPDGRRLGAHLPLGHGMVRAADRAAEIGASAIQVFSDNPTSWRRRPSLPGELPAFREHLDHHGIAPISIHGPYLINLAGPEPDVAERSIGVLVNELRVARAYGARFLNIHVGSHKGSGVDAGIERLAEGLRRVFDTLDRVDGDGAGEREGAANGEDDAAHAGNGDDHADRAGKGDGTARLVLENGSGGGYGLGSTIEELARIDDTLVAAGVGRERFAFCLDTAHAWAAGYAISDAAGVDRLVDRFDTVLGLDRLAMIHLNDAHYELGSRSDRHEHIGAGRIGSAGLARVLTHPRLGHASYFLETPRMNAGYDAVNLGRALDLAAGRPLSELPPDAFESDGGHGRSAPPEPEPEVHAPRGARR